MQTKYLFALAALLAVAYAASEQETGVLAEEEDHTLEAHNRPKRTILLTKALLAKKALLLGGAALVGSAIYRSHQNRPNYIPSHNYPTFQPAPVYGPPPSLSIPVSPPVSAPVQTTNYYPAPSYPSSSVWIPPSAPQVQPTFIPIPAQEYGQPGPNFQSNHIYRYVTEQQVPCSHSSHSGPIASSVASTGSFSAESSIPSTSYLPSSHEASARVSSFSY